MFGNNSDILQVIQNQQESNLTLSQEISKMADSLEGIKEEMKKTLEGYKDETILLATYENTYRSEGFKFNSLYISDRAVQDNATLVIMYSGLSFTVPLVSGENILNIPDSATYKLVTTSGQNYTAILTRFNTQPAFLSKNTPGNVAVQNQSGTQFLGVNSDGSINTQTQLTGSNAIRLQDQSGYGIDSATLGNDSIGLTRALWNASGNLAFDGTTWNRVRNNVEATLLASGGRIATTVTPLQANYNAKVLVLFLDITVASGTGGLTPYFRYRDPVTGKMYVMNQGISTPITTTGSFLFIIGLGVSGTFGSAVKQIISAPVPRQYDVQIYANDGSSYTYSLGQCLIL